MHILQNADSIVVDYICCIIAYASK